MISRELKESALAEPVEALALIGSDKLINTVFACGGDRSNTILTFINIIFSLLARAKSRAHQECSRAVIRDL